MSIFDTVGFVRVRQDRRRPGPAARTAALPAAWLIAAAALALPAATLHAGDRATATAAGSGDDAAAIEQRLADSAAYLASDELEGRALGGKGIDLAADFIAEEFRQCGLDTHVFGGSPFQKFAVSVGSKLGEKNTLALLGPPEDGKPAQRIELELKTDYAPLAPSGSARFDLPLVFAGYGITAGREKYDDYEGLDVKGKAVLILRHEPQQDNPQSAFAGTKDSPYASLGRKIANAQQHGAAAVVLCTDAFEIDAQVAELRKKWQEALDRLAAEHEKYKKVERPTRDELESQRSQIDARLAEAETWSKRLREAYDPVLPFPYGGGPSRKDFPVVHCCRSAIDRVLGPALGTDLAALERRIDEGPSPASSEIPGWRLAGEVDVRRAEAEARNVVGVLRGEGPHADEAIVIGAHYDHIGLGGFASLAGEKDVIHNGADDNASGTAAVIEIARALAARPKKLPRTVVFVAFTGEERGLLGSREYVEHPLVPLDKTIAMLNLDMVGRLRDNKLMVFGAGSGKHFEELLDRVNAAHGLDLQIGQRAAGGSDHFSFYSRKIPVMHFFTGMHPEYHRPSDDFETLNVAGMRQVAALVEDVAVALAEADARPEFVAGSGGLLQMLAEARRAMFGDAKRPFLGTIPDFGAEANGYAISGVVDGGPADRAGLKSGDVVVRFGEDQIGGLEDIAAALDKHKAGDRVKLLVRRGAEELSFEVTLDPPR